MTALETVMPGPAMVSANCWGVKPPWTVSWAATGELRNSKRSPANRAMSDLLTVNEDIPVLNPCLGFKGAKYAFSENMCLKPPSYVHSRIKTEMSGRGCPLIESLNNFP